jgi:hypothetical protein
MLWFPAATATRILAVLRNSRRQWLNGYVEFGARAGFYTRKYAL